MVKKKEQIEDDDWCIKCGKTVDIITLNEYGGKCPTCWNERNR